MPEGPIHDENTLQWLLRPDSDADEALQIAALGHDIERAIEDRRVKKAHFSNFEQFKATHARNSAAILREISVKFRLDPAEEVYSPLL